MAIDFETAQAVVGLALINSRYSRMLVRERGRAMREVEGAPGVPAGIRLTEDDRLHLGAIRAATLQEFAHGVERLCGDVRLVPTGYGAGQRHDDFDIETALMAPQSAAASGRPTQGAG